MKKIITAGLLLATCTSAFAGAKSDCPKITKGNYYCESVKNMGDVLEEGYLPYYQRAGLKQAFVDKESRLAKVKRGYVTSIQRFSTSNGKGLKIGEEIYLENGGITEQSEPRLTVREMKCTAGEKSFALANTSMAIGINSNLEVGELTDPLEAVGPQASIENSGSIYTLVEVKKDGRVKITRDIQADEFSMEKVKAGAKEVQQYNIVNCKRL